MLLSFPQKTIISYSHSKFPPNFPTKNSKTSPIISARKQDLPQNSEPTKKPLFQFKLSTKIIAQSAIAILGLGFVDAGYSGDWSRIGVITKEFEEVLKTAAFAVVPLCLLLIFLVSKNPDNQQ